MPEEEFEGNGNDVNLIESPIFRTVLNFIHYRYKLEPQHFPVPFSFYDSF